MKSKNRKWRLFQRFTTEEKVGSVPYLDRIYVIECPRFSIILQRIGGIDPSRDFHDHPWSFFSIIVWGRYIEATPQYLAVYRRWWNFKRAEDLHTINYTYGKPVWTILFCGPRRREWGFIVDGEWVHHLDHIRARGKS